MRKSDRCFIQFDFPVACEVVNLEISFGTKKNVLGKSEKCERDRILEGYQIKLYAII